QILAGGRHRALAEHLAGHVDIPGYHVVTDLAAIPRELRGLHPDNPVNRVRCCGAQLELSARVRGISPRSGVFGHDGLCAATSALVRGLATAARSWNPDAPR
ncbi:MAG: poly-gamma-glutamate hydrolase family protein, partial [Mycobacterium sp.]